ncbi:hypothetical protein QBC44DRAFT_346247 [Cladorrhinum sp. PSN332]|nr:hypothetical protein QBC44DRAFT_346247 [Cladorrhinum sp. PSN332]
MSLPVMQESAAKCVWNSSLEFLRTLEPSLSLTDTFAFSRRCIKPINTPDLPRESITNISGPFFTHKPTELSFSSCPSTTLPPCEPLPLPVTPAYPQDKEYTHLLFGVASTYERIQSSLPAFQHWLSGTSARIIIVISDAHRLAPKYTLLDLEKQYRKAGIQATILKPQIQHGLPRKDETEIEKNKRLGVAAPVEELHFLLVGTLAEYATKETKWLGIVDDDTFFPSLYALSESLSVHDHTKPVWLGALADNWHSLTLFGHQAYGGAGIFLSPPLVSTLTGKPNNNNNNNILHSCIFSSTSKTGDSLLRDCITTHTPARLKILPGLNQHDLRSDASGFFESNPFPLLSIHHWKSWYKSPVVSISLVAKLCGDCLLRRYMFEGDEVVWVNGYSVSQYSEGVLSGIDLDRVEGTWEGAAEEEEEKKKTKGVGGYEFAYGGLRPKLTDKERKRWKLVDARIERVKVKDGGGDNKGKRKLLRQVYVWYDKERGGKGKDGVVVVEWEF